MPEYCVYDQAKPKVAQANNAKTNKSALIILYHGWASVETSTLKKNLTTKIQERSQIKLLD